MWGFHPVVFIKLGLKTGPQFPSIKAKCRAWKDDFTRFLVDKPNLLETNELADGF